MCIAMPESPSYLVSKGKVIFTLSPQGRLLPTIIIINNNIIIAMPEAPSYLFFKGKVVIIIVKIVIVNINILFIV